MVGWMDRKKQKDGWMDIKIDGTVENGWMVGWIDKTNIWMVGRKTKKYEKIDGWLVGWIEKNSWMVGWMETKQMDKNGLLDGQKKWMVGWIKKWMVRCMDRKNRWMVRRKDNKYEKNRWMVGWIKKYMNKIDGWMDIKKMKTLMDRKYMKSRWMVE